MSKRPLLFAGILGGIAVVLAGLVIARSRRLPPVTATPPDPIPPEVAP